MNKEEKFMDKKISASYEATKTNESCMLFNKSEADLILGVISIAIIICFICLICFCIFGEFEYIPYCIATVSCCFILIYIMHKCKQNKINKFIKNNKSNFIYRIDGRIYELQQGTIKEWSQLESKEYDFIVLTNQFSVDGNGVAYVIRDKSTLSDPDAKVYIDKNVSETIRIHYNQITEIETGKILHPTELKQFLTQE